MTVSGTFPTDFQGDRSTKYQIALRFLNGKSEVVSQGQLLNEDIPTSPFVLAHTSKQLFVASNREVYVRPLASSSWRTWNYRNDEVLPFWGRALMPSRYAHNEEFESNWPNQSNHDRLPTPPSYVFERWILPAGLVVMRQDGQSEFSGKPTPLWPKRLVFRSEKLDLARTMELEPRFRLRSVPTSVRVEVLKMSFASDFDWDRGLLEDRKGESFCRYDKVRSIAGAREMGRDAYTLTSRFHSTPLSSWWSAKGRTTLHVRGLCGDPNSNLVHFAWKVGNGNPQWAIAHDGEWRPLREDACVLEKPYLFARFSWKVRQTHTRSQK